MARVLVPSHLSTVNENSPFEMRDRILEERREKYLADPVTEYTRNRSHRSPQCHPNPGAAGLHPRQRRDICMRHWIWKPTQISQLISDDCIDDCINRGEGSNRSTIRVQPCHLCATNVAQRVAQEGGGRFGSLIGCRVRFETNCRRYEGPLRSA